LKRGESFCEEENLQTPKGDGDEVTLTKQETAECSSNACVEEEEEVLIRRPNIPLDRKVIIVDINQVYDNLDQGRGIDVKWPTEQMRTAGGRTGWDGWYPQEGMVGNIIHYWVPFHKDPQFCSKVNHIILLIRIQEKFVPINERGVKEYKMITAPIPTTSSLRAMSEEPPTLPEPEPEETDSTGNNNNSSNIYLEEC
jgi:hypothetical protein